MWLLLKVRDRISRFYGEHDTVIRILSKFCMALCAFAMINASLGQISFLCKPVVVGALALVCAFLPSNSTVMIGAGMILVHFYGISLEAAIAGGFDCAATGDARDDIRAKWHLEKFSDLLHIH